MNKLPITVCLISGAEAHRIGRTLQSVANWVSELVVVLNEDVRDGTEEVVLAHGGKVYREPWKGFLAQKNSAASKAAQPWILSLDADEVVSDALRLEIERTFAQEAMLSSHNAFDFPRCTFSCGRWIRHGDWYPDRVLRLHRRSAATWSGIDPHPRLQVDGKVGHLGSDLLHYSNESIDRQIAKIAAYSDDTVRNHQAAGRSASWFDLAVRPAWRFFRAYFIRLGFLDGWPGYYIACWTAFYTVTRYAKVREAELPKIDQNKLP